MWYQKTQTSSHLNSWLFFIEKKKENPESSLNKFFNTNSFQSWSLILTLQFGLAVLSLGW